MDVFATAGAACQFKSREMLYSAILTGEGRNNGGFVEYEIRITATPPGGAVRRVGSSLWAMPSCIGSPGFWKAKAGNVVQSRDVTGFANSLWKDANLHALH